MKAQKTSSNLVLPGESEERCEEAEATTNSLLLVGKTQKRGRPSLEAPGNGTGGNFFTSLTPSALSCITADSCICMWQCSLAPKFFFHSHLLKELLLGHLSSVLGSLRSMDWRKSKSMQTPAVELSGHEFPLSQGVGTGSLTKKGDTGFRGVLLLSPWAWHFMGRGTVTVESEQLPPKAMLSKLECAYTLPGACENKIPRLSCWLDMVIQHAFIPGTQKMPMLQVEKTYSLKRKAKGRNLGCLGRRTAMHRNVLHRITLKPGPSSDVKMLAKNLEYLVDCWKSPWGRHPAIGTGQKVTSGLRAQGRWLDAESHSKGVKVNKWYLPLESHCGHWEWKGSKVETRVNPLCVGEMMEKSRARLGLIFRATARLQ